MSDLPTVGPGVNAPWVQMAKHITTLFSDGSLQLGEVMEVRCFRNKRSGPRGFFRDHGTLIRDAMKWAVNWDVYVGVGSRRCPDGAPMPCHHESPGAKDHVGRVPAAWCEIDIGKPYASAEQIVAALDAARLEPDLMVGSGGGVHAYFLLDEPTTDLLRLEQLNRGLVRRVGKDMAVDASRVLRLAGTLNFKYNPPRPAQILQRRMP